MKDRIVFPTNLSRFIDPSRRAIRRFPTPAIHPHSRRERPQDQIMRDE